MIFALNIMLGDIQQLLFFKNGNKKEFDGPRTTEGIISWLDKKSGPIAVELTTAESIKEFSNSNNVVAYSSQKNDAFKAYLVAAEDSRLAEMKFAYVSDSALFNGNVDGSVVYFTKDGQQVVPEENLATAELLATFLFDSTFPVFQEIDASNFKNYASRGKKLLLAWIKTKGENAQQEIDVISKFATQYTQFSFGYISHENFGPNMDRMGASGKVVPAITLLSFTDNKPIVFEGEWNEENIQEWIEGVISGKYKYASKSEAVPETQGNVVTLVGKNFDEIVHDTTKDVLVEFYAPWCGHCKNLVPEYEKLGELFSKVDDVVIGKIDLTANDVDTAHFDVKGFPTILLYKRDAKATPLQFQGARDAKSIAAWIKDNSASEAVKLISHDEL
eukprot:TRINITY_DN86_c0_g1_i4.p2 TRINITY_DN86_c0_g1~~TRINITY_DN86_c0_g1_i4.p2  ORF type:complete len:389 (-),score=132.70 TRINITY_DN86_c0_g1_i4:55-1221(-)